MFSQPWQHCHETVFLQCKWAASTVTVVFGSRYVLAALAALPRNCFSAMQIGGRNMLSSQQATCVLTIALKTKEHEVSK
jgi:hypothetical protein